MGLDFSAVKLPFGPMDLLVASVSLLGVVGGFVLLGMAVPFVQKLVAMVTSSIRNRSKSS
ncbi:TPA: hypothetical protein QCV86_005362 [Bacillus thuringiensis]|uniref:hypothetical protein n=1 Tax=Bacillus cereus group TaxID=86661 RepID=UPI0003D2F1BC|nr:MULTISPECIES: hypothetical protein [Bacillus cereus group]MDA2543694.1 hypothetical protein [Bacillus cereus]HDR6828420.1 hypothetical protein [Bacillus thuringiensis]HDX9614500.1 hypothetical protein [Bacillus toyonensis]ETE88984.1 hypothetical protein C623_0232745 [Bacillus thuringiensis serovar aizawai str. Hu4-2]MEC2958561.1 hypothetical protein [Bacillus cereus]